MRERFRLAYRRLMTRLGRRPVRTVYGTVTLNVRTGNATIRLYQRTRWWATQEDGFAETARAVRVVTRAYYRRHGIRIGGRPRGGQ